MTARQRTKRRIAKATASSTHWARSAAGFAPCWVVLETTGHRSGKRRQVPLARGPVDGSTAWLVSIHGLHSAYALLGVQTLGVEPRLIQIELK